MTQNYINHRWRVFSTRIHIHHILPRFTHVKYIDCGYPVYVYEVMWFNKLMSLVLSTESWFEDYSFKTIKYIEKYGSV